jgi:hypothetical protein
VGCIYITNQISKVENQIRKSLGLLILTAFRTKALFLRVLGSNALEGLMQRGDQARKGMFRC